VLAHGHYYGRSLFEATNRTTDARSSSDRAPSVVETSPESRLGLAKT
jgi:hypothetical protein